MTAQEKIKSMLEEVRAEITDVERMDTKSYQIGVAEGLQMALEFLKTEAHKNN